MKDDESARAEERRLLEGYLSGSEKEFREVEGWILHTIDARYGILWSDREDLCQRAHEKLVSNLRAGRFRAGSALRTYVLSIVHHTCIDALRRRYLRRFEELPDGLAAEKENPYHEAESAERRRIMHRILGLSPEICRRLWRMIFLEGLRYREIAIRLRIPAGTVKSRMSACRQKALALYRRLQGTLPS